MSNTQLNAVISSLMWAVSSTDSLVHLKKAPVCKYLKFTKKKVNCSNVLTRNHSKVWETIIVIFLLRLYSFLGGVLYVFWNCYTCGKNLNKLCELHLKMLKKIILNNQKRILCYCNNLRDCDFLWNNNFSDTSKNPFQWCLKSENTEKSLLSFCDAPPNIRLVSFQIFPLMLL